MIIPYQNENKIELGIDVIETIFGKLFIVGLILPNNFIELCEKKNINIKNCITKNVKRLGKKYFIN